ncbi:Rv3654c family TadE-like protein [Arthrobacter rhombi]|uniref:Rv3654c family TadE-like protein n=1 Tax=Arthrobacter rhombi TaxID=71253 RepID=UPI003FD44D30
MKTSELRGSGAEHGSGTLLVVGLVAGLAFCLVVVLSVSAVATAASRAAGSAELAAVAAADAARGLTTGEPCAVAARTAARNGAQVDQCLRSGSGGVLVDIWTSVPLGPGLSWLAPLGVEASGRSRAGPPRSPWAPPA